MGVSQPSRRRTGQRLAVAACCGALVLPALSPVRAQDDNGGVKMTLGVQSSLRSDSNYAMSTPGNGRGTVFDTRLSFGLTSETRASTLSFTAATTARAAKLPAPAGSVTGVEDPTLTLSYTRTGARSRLDVNARYNKADLDFVDPLTDQILIADPSNPGNFILTNATGTRTALSYGAGIETGIDMPVGLTLRVNRSEIDYAGTVGASLYDTKTDSATATVRMDLSPSTQASLTVSATDYTARNATRTTRDTRALSLGLTHQFDEATQMTASVGRSRIVNDSLAGTVVREGTTYGLSASRAFAVGQVGLSYARSIDTNGSRDTLSLTHARETALSRMNLSLGLSKGSAGTTAVIANAAVSRDLARGRLNLSLARSVSTDDALNDVLSTRASASYAHEINDVSSMSFGVTFARTEDGGAGATAQTDRSSVNITYNRALTEDWQMSAGVEHRRLDRTTGTASGNAVFVTLGRSFDLRP